MWYNKYIGYSCQWIWQRVLTILIDSKAYKILEVVGSGEGINDVATLDFCERLAVALLSLTCKINSKLAWIRALSCGLQAGWKTTNKGCFEGTAAITARTSHF